MIHVISDSVMSDSFQPYWLEPVRLLCPWDSPGKNTGVAVISFSRESSQPRDQIWVSCIADRCFTVWATREAQNDTYSNLILKIWDKIKITESSTKLKPLWMFVWTVFWELSCIISCALHFFNVLLSIWQWKKEKLAYFYT